MGDATGVTVGIDIGTTSVKAVAVDGDGTVLRRTRIPHPLVVPAADRMEHDANKAWRRGPRRALRELGADGVRAVSVVAMVPSLTAVDRRGMPRTPGLLYGDARGGRGEGEAEGFLRWTAAQEPGAHGYWPAQAVANRELGGEPVVDTSVAASSMPVFSPDTWGWDEALITDAGGRLDQFPRVAGMGEAVGTVDGTETVLDAGGVDAIGEQIVAGAVEPGDVLIIFGTTLIVWVVAPEWVEVPGLVTIPHMGGAGQFIGAASNVGGLFVNWAANLLGRPRGTADPGRIPLWEPYPRGERVPIGDPHRRAALRGLDLTSDAAGARRAAFEASGFVARRIIDGSGVTPRRIVGTGGGVRVPEWTHAVADCTGLPIDVVAVPEGAALGAAWLARMAAGLESSMNDAARWARTGERIEPDPAWQRAAAERYDRFLELSDSSPKPLQD